MILRLFCRVCAFTISIASTLAFADASFTPLGDLPGGSFNSFASDVSDDGSVVVGRAWSASGPEAFRWTCDGGMVGLGDLPPDPFVSTSSGVSGDGSVVVGSGRLALSDDEAFRWTNGGGMVGLGDLGFSSHALGVSGDGSTVVGWGGSASGIEAWRWTSSDGMVGLGVLPGIGFRSVAHAVSDDGSVIVGESSPGISAFRWTGSGGMVGLGDLGAIIPTSAAMGVSGDGLVVVGRASSPIGMQPFRWTSGDGMVGLVGLSLFGGFAVDASRDGSVIVGLSNTSSPLTAVPFRWTSAGGMVSVVAMLTDAGVDLTGWELGLANGVSADGNTIVGQAINPSGDNEGWVANFGSAPIADAGDNDSLAVLGSLVTLDGTESLDPDGGVMTFFWTLNPPLGSTAVLDDPTSDTPSFTADQYGDYVATLVVTNGVCHGSAPDSVTVGFANLEPVADAGPDQAVVVGDTVVLDGTGSTDANMDMLTYLWSFDSTPVGSGAALINPTTDSPSFVVDAAGDYNIQLVVNDGLLNSAPDSVLVMAISEADAAAQAAMDLIAGINTLGSSDFSNRNRQRVLANKVAVVLGMIEAGNYMEAFDKLTDDVLPKTDGCALTGAPDANDWITNCTAQSVIYPLVLDVIDLVRRLVSP